MRYYANVPLAAALVLALDASTLEAQYFSYLSVGSPVIGQQSNTWCWAASTQMIATHYNLTLPYASFPGPLAQWQIAESGYPPPAVNDCPRDLCQGILLLPGTCRGPHTPELFHFRIGGKTTDWPLSWEAIMWELREGRPLMYWNCITSRPDYSCNEGDFGHIVTLAGTLSLQLQPNLGLRFVQIHDPLPCCRGDVYLLNYFRYRRSGVLEGVVEGRQYRRFHVKTYYSLQDCSKGCEELPSGMTIQAERPSEGPTEPTFPSAEAAANSFLAVLSEPSFNVLGFLSTFMSSAGLGTGIEEASTERFRLGGPISQYYLLPEDIEDDRFSATTLGLFLVNSGLRIFPVLHSETPLFSIAIESVFPERYAIAEIGRPLSVSRYFAAVGNVVPPDATAKVVKVVGLGVTFLILERNGVAEFRYIDDCSGAPPGKVVSAEALVTLLRNLVGKVD